MNGEVVVKGVAGHPRPARGVSLDIEMDWVGDVEVLGIQGILQHDARTVATSGPPLDPRWNRVSPYGRAGRGERSKFRLLFPLAPDAVHFLEEARAGGDLPLSLQLHYTCLVLTGSAESPSKDVFWCTAWATDWRRVPQSEWVRVLKEMEWRDGRLFELPALPILGAAGEQDRIYLEQSREHLRTGAYRSAIAECRLAIEAAAKRHGAGDLKAGFAALLNHAFPSDAERAKREAYDSLVHALSGVAHVLGRHASTDPVPVARGDAELVLVATTGLLSLLDRAIADLDGAAAVGTADSGSHAQVGRPEVRP